MMQLIRRLKNQYEYTQIAKSIATKLLIEVVYKKIFKPRDYNIYLTFLSYMIFCCHYIIVQIPFLLAECDNDKIKNENKF